MVASNMHWNKKTNDMKMSKKFAANILIALMLFTVSCVEDDMYNGPATIEKIEYSPTTVTPDDEVTVTATITDLQGVTAARIQYKVNSGTQTEVTMTKGSGNTYTGVIPKQADKAEVAFVVVADNQAGMKAVSGELTFTVGAVPVPYENLVLNELNGNDKFIEVFNKGAVAIKLKDVYIEKDEKLVWTGSETQTLPAGGYLLLYSEDVQADHAGHPADQFFGSGLSAKKPVRVQLFSPAALSLDDFNLVDYEKPAPASYSRWENGVGKWVYATATPGVVNVAGSEEVAGLH